jgi:hypothetical protein
VTMNFCPSSVHRPLCLPLKSSLFRLAFRINVLIDIFF